MKKDLIKKWKKANIKDEKKYEKTVNRIFEKKNKNILKQVGQVQDQVFKEMSCMDCANCCKSIPPQLIKSDVKRISKHLSLSKKQFEKKYTIIDEDGDMVFKKSPCVFLEEDNACSIYEVRPEACRSYPHTDKSIFKHGAEWHAINVVYCPAVYHVLERMKAMLASKKK